MSACVTVDNSLTERDTIAEEDRASFDDFSKLLDGDVYYGYFYDRNYVWLKIHDPDTHKVIAERKFKGNGKAMEYLLQGPGVKPEDLTLDGPVSKEKTSET